MHTFTFSIRQALRESFEIFKKHASFFLLLSFVTTVLNIISTSDTSFSLVTALFIFISIVWAVIGLKASLALINPQQEKATISSIKMFIPSWKELLSVICVGLLSALFIFAGLVVLIIPGFYIIIRLTFSNLAYLDKKEGIRSAIRYSWNITKDHFWTVFLVMLVIFFLYFIGFLFFGIGLLITYPIILLFSAKAYVALSEAYQSNEAIIVQPVEIAPTSTEPETQTSTNE